jgi:hypothetical protein
MFREVRHLRFVRLMDIVDIKMIGKLSNGLTIKWIDMEVGWSGCNLNALAAITELKAVSTVRRVTVSGGEPFSNFDALCAIGGHAAGLDLSFRVVSNASFATSDAVAMTMISALTRYKLEALSIRAKTLTPSRSICRQSAAN